MFISLPLLIENIGCFVLDFRFIPVASKPSQSPLRVCLSPEAEDRDMNCVVSSLVQVMCDPYCRTLAGFQGLVQKEWVVAGHRFLSRANYHREREKEEVAVSKCPIYYALALNPPADIWIEAISHTDDTPG